MSDLTTEQKAEVSKMIEEAKRDTRHLPFRFIGRQVVTDLDWDFRRKLTRGKQTVETDPLKVLVFS